MTYARLAPRPTLTTGLLLALVPTALTVVVQLSNQRGRRSPGAANSPAREEGRKIVARYNSCRDLRFYLWDDVQS